MSAENRSLMKLPNLNVESILLKLPLQSLFVCCCVSKSLLNLIKNDSHFAETHFAKSEPQLMIQSLIRTRCHLIDLDVDLTATERVQIKPTFNLPKPFFDITHSCNGLLLLERVYTDEDFHQCMVFNPVTGEYIIIPETVYPCLNVTCAFIYSPVTHRFGIFRVFHRVIPDLVDLSEPVIVELDPSSDSASDSDSGLDPDPDPNYGPGIDFNSDRSDMYIDSASNSDSDADTVYSVSDTFGEIYVSGSDSWESLGNVPFSPRSLYSSCQLYNTTHWLCGDENVENVIVFFNFGTYRFGEIRAPAHISKGHARASDDVSLIVVEDCLTIFDGYSTDDRFEVWKMREYGNVESWTRVCTIDTQLFSAYGILTRSFRPVLWRANGEVVMVCASGFIVYYDLLEKEGRVVYHPPLFRPWSVAAHRPSFISLRKAVRGSNLEVLNVESRFVDDVINEFSFLELVETFSEMQIMID